MRTFLFAFAFMLTLAAPADAASRNFGVTSFTKVRVDGPFKVTLATGVAPFAKASGSAAALDRLTIEVRGDTLVVLSNVSSWGGYPGANAGPVEVSVGTHDLTDAWLNGAGSLAIDRVKGLSFALSVQGIGRSRDRRRSIRPDDPRHRRQRQRQARRQDRQADRRGARHCDPRRGEAPGTRCRARGGRLSDDRCRRRRTR